MDENKIIPQNVHFRRGRVHKYFSLKTRVISYELQPNLLKHLIFEDTWQARENEWLPYLKNDLYQMLSHMLNFQKVWKKQPVLL